MKKFLKAILGVTLLEIMLVLAIAAMVILMSVRYYQSASASQQSNAIIEQLQAISAASDSLAQATGSYTSVNGAALGNAALSPLLPVGGLTAPWGATITVVGTAAGTYTMALSTVPAAVCPLMVSKMTSNNHYTVTSGACGSTAAAITFQYNASP